MSISKFNLGAIKDTGAGNKQQRAQVKDLHDGVGGSVKLGVVWV